jgi:serine/threonine protein kinase
MNSAKPPTDASSLFEEARELRGDERRVFLDNLPPERAAAIAELLRADEEAEASPVWQRSALHAAALRDAEEHPVPLEAIGPYRILERIGSGGMGVVYLAEGDYDGVRKRVAIKAMPYAFDDAMVRRFRQERLILASLEHPNIARMLDAGTTPEGIPYLVMEYVDGVTLTRYATERKLSVENRLGIFRSICGAVAYAHRNLVVHRDLKPANILITKEGVPKLLDFGIARLLAEAGPDLTGAAIMTRAYASPEQLAGGAITTASDIYSLGVILRELVADEKPAGDIENVIAMALREAPERRYASAADFAEDVRRVMKRYPVLARPDTVGYRVRRFISRRPVEVGIVLALAVALAIAGGVALEQYRAAGRRFNEVRAIANSFLFEVYDSIGDLPGATQTRMVVARRAQQYLDVLSRDRPSDRALRRELAAAYLRLGDILGRPSHPNLGDNAGALANYRKAEALLEDDDGAKPALGEVYLREGRLHIRQAERGKALEADDRAVALLDPGGIDGIDASLEASLVHMEVGAERRSVKELAISETLSNRAKTALTELLRKDPGRERLQALKSKACEFLAFAHSDTAVITGSREELIRAASNFEERLGISQSLSSTYPGKYRRDLADALVEVSNGWRDAGDLTRAEGAAREGLRRFEEIAAADPANREAAFDVLTAHLALGRTLAVGGHAAEGAEHLRRFIAGVGQTPGVQQDRATLHALDVARALLADQVKQH